ncbi:serine/threonine/dual specificity protein kinase, catalytic domain-containing protein [Artemisia annua]|uniref:Serine/threonine/dual specificity protein kinase, catalytic domain-containing protein n=1 Tax=Artemisia annua TaxID=35608 RepID=A0A2U1QA98_ARTAN|nr:serine/threonine/dual specificity protein kinase, catalytic domain-containing protein [Artemisia annua]
MKRWRLLLNSPDPTVPVWGTSGAKVTEWVYKGEIKSQESGSTIVAIKRLDTTSDQGAPEFVAEIETLSRLRHAHLVSLLGCCVDNKEMIIVYEYMPNGTVYHHLHKGNTSLSWSQRLRISLGAARGLEYLHTGVGTKQGVVHRDVKTSNILLDEDWEAKISDFGLAKTCPINQSRTYVNTRIKGTFGYLDPQIFLTGNLTRKTDVFAFGVVLFELLSGRHAVLPDGDEDLSLATWAQSCVRKRNLDKLVSAEIRGELSPKCLKEFTKIAYRCLHSDPKERPTMAEVVVALQLSERLQEKFDNSTQPAGLFGFVWKLPSYFSYPTRENSGHDDKRSSRMGKINIIRSSVASNGDLSDLHTVIRASKINSDSSSVPTTEDGGDYKDENARAKVTKAMRTFIEEHRSATELMSLRHKGLEDERPSHKNVLLHSKKTVANKRTSNIVLSDNLDAATTKDELLKAQEREQKLLQQDEKVEQTKDQRNTLESFVYDTRSKLQNAYKRFVTDLENEGITKSLQETEDWLYEVSDDECDGQRHTGRLEDLKKLLEPIENRYKDENKVQATKPLLVMIEENRLVADLLPLENKMQLINACTEAEQYLSTHSPENYDPIGWPNFIKKTMDTFKRMCDEAIRPKLSIPKPGEPVDNKIKNENKAQATKTLLSMIEEYYCVADSLPHENKMKLIDACTEAEQYLSTHSPENYDPIGWSNFIKKTMDTFKRMCEEAIRPKLSIPKPVEPLITACTEVEQYLSGLSPDNFDQISWFNHINDTMGIFNRRCEEAIQYEPSSPEHPETVESDRSCNNVDSQTENPMDRKQTGKSVVGNRTGNSMDGNRTGKPVERNQMGKPVERNQTSKPVKPDQTSKLVKQEQTGKPNRQTRETGPVKQTRGWEPNVQTRETGPNASP